MKKLLEFIRRFLGRIVLLLNLCAIAWLAICALASVTHPADIKYIALFSLTTPVAIFANISFALAWLIFSRRKARSLLSIIALVACYKLIGVVFGMNYFKSSDLATRNNTLKVMHWNVHGMGLFDEPNEKEHERKIIEFVQQEHPDVLCLPEFNTPKTKIMTPAAEKIIRDNDYRDYRFQADNTLGKKIFLGTAIFSRYPLFNFKANKLSDYIYMLQADMQLKNGDTIRMLFGHLNTFGLSDNDKDYIEELTQTAQGINTDIKHSKPYLWKFNYAFLRRARETKVTRSIMAASPYPVIFCGDLNDLPGSYTYTRFSEVLNDAFLDYGHGLGRTYNRLSPTLRIDYIFYDPEILRCIGYKSPYTSLSDHSPVIANFEIKPALQG
ncbi:MAG: endonuclease/exonuclease/phosphatase family protein [Chitinophagales bacterium]|nr:endonuclease/exonuclease/phosphatase family protein [Chitinophagales bacterium]